MLQDIMCSCYRITLDLVDPRTYCAAFVISGQHMTLSDVFINLEVHFFSLLLLLLLHPPRHKVTSQLINSFGRCQPGNLTATSCQAKDVL